MSWQPIETVPMDGTPVLLLASKTTMSGYASCIHSWKIYNLARFHDGYWEGGVIGGKWSGGDKHMFTHWMPLPEPPQ